MGSRSSSQGPAAKHSQARMEFVLAGLRYLRDEPEPSPAEPASNEREFFSMRCSSFSDEPLSSPVVKDAWLTRRRPRTSELGIRLVAERSGRSHAAPLFHFPDRLALVAAVAAAGFRDLLTLLRSLPPAASGWSQLRTLVLSYARYAGRWPAVFATMYEPDLARPIELLLSVADPDGRLQGLNAMFGGDEDATQRRLQAYEELLAARFDTLSVFIEAAGRGREDGSVAGGQAPEFVAQAMATVADGLAWQRVTERQGSERLLDQFAEQVLDLVSRGLRGN